MSNKWALQARRLGDCTPGCGEVEWTGGARKAVGRGGVCGEQWPCHVARRLWHVARCCCCQPRSKFTFLCDGSCVPCWPRVPVCRKTTVQARHSHVPALAGGLCAFAACGRLSPLAVSRCLRVPGTVLGLAENPAPRGRRHALSCQGGQRPPHRHLDPARRRPRRALCASRPQRHCPRVWGQTAADRGPGGRKWDVEVWAGPWGGSFRPRPAPDVCWPSWPASAGGHFAPASRLRMAVSLGLVLSSFLRGCPSPWPHVSLL